MPVTLTTRSAWGTVSSTDAYVTGTFTPAPNELLVAAGAAGNGNDADIAGIAVYDSLGGTWTQLALQVATPLGGLAFVYVKDAGPAPQAQTVTVAASPNTVCDVEVAVAGAAGAAPAYLQAAQAALNAQGATGTVSTVTITPAYTGSVIVGAAGANVTANTPAPGGSASMASPWGTSQGTIAPLNNNYNFAGGSSAHWGANPTNATFTVIPAGSAPPGAPASASYVAEITPVTTIDADITNTYPQVVSQGIPYALTAWVYLAAQADMRIQTYVFWYDPSFNFLGLVFGPLVTVAANSWQQVTASLGVPPAGATQAAPAIGANTSVISPSPNPLYVANAIFYTNGDVLATFQGSALTTGGQAVTVGVSAALTQGALVAAEIIPAVPQVYSVTALPSRTWLERWGPSAARPQAKLVIPAPYTPPYFVSGGDASGTAADAGEGLALADTDASGLAADLEALQVFSPPAAAVRVSRTWLERFGPSAGHPQAKLALPVGPQWVLVRISDADASGVTADSGQVPPPGTETCHGEDSGFAFPLTGEISAGADAGELISLSDSDRSGFAVDLEFSAWPHDSDSEGPAAEYWYWSGPLRDTEVSGRTADGGEVTYIEDADASTGNDAGFTLEVYSYQPLFRWTGGYFQLRAPVPHAAGREASREFLLWQGERPDGTGLRLAAAFAQGLLSFVSSSDSGSAAEGDADVASLDVVLVISPALSVTVEVS